MLSLLLSLFAWRAKLNFKKSLKLGKKNAAWQGWQEVLVQFLSRLQQSFMSHLFFYPQLQQTRPRRQIWPASLLVTDIWHIQICLNLECLHAPMWCTHTSSSISHLMWAEKLPVKHWQSRASATDHWSGWKKQVLRMQVTGRGSFVPQVVKVTEGGKQWMAGSGGVTLFPSLAMHCLNRQFKNNNS